MKIEGWKYYNHAMIPDIPPHETPDISSAKVKDFWKKKGVLLARWSSEFDCKVETEWWYVIKDTPFEISELKAKRRYEITKGEKNFRVQIIDPTQYANELAQVYREALTGYPQKYRPNFNEEQFKKDIQKLGEGNLIYGGFDTVTGELCGYALLNVHEKYAALSVVKTIPAEENRAINAALINRILRDFNSRLEKGFYICDGERNISHETGFQNYLEKYFGFRKAYCKLNVLYRPVINIIVNILYPFRKWIRQMDTNRLIHNIIAVLYMEELRRRSQQKGRD